MIPSLKHLEVELRLDHGLDCLSGLLDLPFNSGVHAPLDRPPHVFTPLFLRRLLEEFVSKSIDTLVYWITFYFLWLSILGKLLLSLFIIPNFTTRSRHKLLDVSFLIFIVLTTLFLNPYTVPLVRKNLLLHLPINEIDLFLPLCFRWLLWFRQLMYQMLQICITEGGEIYGCF